MPTLSARANHISISPIGAVRAQSEALGDVIRLEAGEPDFNTPEPIIRAAQKALDEGWTKYTGSAGVLALRQALAHYDAPKLGRTPDPAREICITMGGTHGLFLTFLALLNIGDEVLIPDPGWPTYERLIRTAGGIPVPYTLDPQRDFRVDHDAVLAAVSTRTRAILINSPSNPTGRVLGHADLRFFADLAQERDLWVVSDEVYERIVFDQLAHESVAAMSGMAERTVVIGAFSKTFAMTGWRLGHVVGPAAVVEAAIKFQGSVNTCPNAAAQVAAIAALAMPPAIVQGMVAEFEARRNLFQSELATIPAGRGITPQGTFFTFVDFGRTGMPDMELARHLLQEARVTSIPGSSFGRQGRGFLRFSIVRSPDEIRTGLQRIRTALAGLPTLRTGH